MFVVRGVSKVFEGSGRAPLTVLQHIELDIRPGEFLTIIGPSGCGKTTLMNLLGGFVRPTTGSVLKDGAEIAEPGPDRTMVFQDYALFPWLTVADNVAFGLRAKGVGRPELDRRVSHFLNLVGLSGFADAYPSQLSGGMRQRVSIARALAPDPDVVLMDEPFAALDSLTRDKLQEELLAIWSKSRKTFVLITHNIEEAVFLSDRIVVMGSRPGRIRSILDIDLPRPRQPDIRIRGSLFLELKQRISDLVRDVPETAPAGAH
ncbi:ABC transporter ATP-binding protein [Bradyrhizobium sp. Arg237L]|uniref:ABC transporter ATP-binding protein n=1 Tax=Bradyrhizobium sp. Arg237L TaxID=3003352 RepID=UPI00249E522C|nr:ABC transporter ATP-binding protein [Bradyrhizobium sp. Arg237L]MDI4234021.1 ABC transporter ATP-binding protein [Bradyrhizobium sp. Arg237L]